jgi:hypothetical protein
MLQSESAPPGIISSLQNWMNGNGCIARAESTYLDDLGDLISVASSNDTVVKWLETLVEHIVARFKRLWSKVSVE